MAHPIFFGLFLFAAAANAFVCYCGWVDKKWHPIHIVNAFFVVFCIVRAIQQI